MEEYAKSHDKHEIAVKRGTAATGKLMCGRSVSTANLVIKEDIIIGVAHPLVDPDTCQKKNKAEDCKFQVGDQRPVAINQLVASGTECPPKKKNSDWAIYRLARPVSGVKPYRLATRPLDAIDPDKKITLVGAMSADFKRIDPKTGKSDYAKHLQDCTIQRLSYVTSPVEFASDCSGSLGKSGGAILTGNIEDPEIIGISIGNVGPRQDFDLEMQTGEPLPRQFDRKTAFDASIALDGDFVKALRMATK